ncbi:formate dehydrogenase subunit gamma [Acuticoccus sp. I52.16.1]|uniref:formate dehydrogenase subunit gamma n=1 Tax=Acuticoccus sp. I52.16.1 TaxID=2928472 RepID=UPI001FD23161|nr:formate dehydrogenase subunit gamma [Acuticoccus sp. I52.16.1]UOM35264.1 formate dehydrogenase subunit gamma [Acuticoccus sp. I52.16.1]
MRWLDRWLAALLLAIVSVALVQPSFAQEQLPTKPDSGIARQPASLGKAGNSGTDAALDRIMARQRGEVISEPPRTAPASAGGADPHSAATIAGELGAGLSYPDAYRAIRYGTSDVTTTAHTPAAGVLIQTGGMEWLKLRRGPLREWGGILLLAVIGVLALFFLIRGRIRIRAGKSGRTILRFTFIERFAHWLLAGSFVLLALSGLFMLFGRNYLMDVMGKEAYSVGVTATKWVHNNVSWAFMLGLVLVLVFWVWHNIPSRTDWQWLKAGGGIVGKGHPHAKKFNAGQKVVFWVTILLGASVSASGLALLFPFELPMFAKTFAAIDWTGIPGLLGFQLPTELAPQEEQQLAQMWHAIVSFVMMAVILAHIYIGTVGMEGAFDAMGNGEVDLNWAREHHDLWVAEREQKAAARGAPDGAVAPAE